MIALPIHCNYVKCTIAGKYHGITDMRPDKIDKPMLGKKWKPDDPRYKNKDRVCSVESCNKPFYAKGLCYTHYTKLSRSGMLEYKRNVFVKCKVEGCNKDITIINKSGYCNFHFIRNKNNVPLDRPKGIKGELNPRWNGGIFEYPNHYKMKKMRKEILKESNYICHFCGCPANQIHHLDHSKDNHSKENLVAVCHSCNQKHRKNSNKVETSKFIRLYGMTINDISKQIGKCRTAVFYYHKQGKLFSLLGKKQDIIPESYYEIFSHFGI